MAQKHLYPQSPMLNPDGHPRREWQEYLGGIEKISKRLDEIDALAPAATLADAIAKLNEILAAFQTG